VAVSAGAAGGDVGGGAVGVGTEGAGAVTESSTMMAMLSRRLSRLARTHVRPVRRALINPASETRAMAVSVTRQIARVA
jgi:hypothetical protein